MRRDRHLPTRTTAAAAVLLTAALTLTGCVGGARGGSDQPGVQASSGTPGPAGDVRRISIATASVQDLQATLRDDGVDDPGRWALTTIQYRPYSAGPDGEHKLRDVLARFGADPDTTAKVTGALAP